jgi:hypothetical protein
LQPHHLHTIPAGSIWIHLNELQKLMHKPVIPVKEEEEGLRKNQQFAT